MSSPDTTFFWHDYETGGVNPRMDRPMQFAGIRTDKDLNEIEDPVMMYCKLTEDYQPSPDAVALTGITPEACAQRGVPEYEFIDKVLAKLGAPGTIGVGFNSMRFDDEITRFTAWRNFREPYEREWANGCGRWDLIDVVRAYHAFFPQNMRWTLNEEGRTSFRLTDLTHANGIAHEGAHDALADVRATIALARLLRTGAPKFWDVCLGLRSKVAVRLNMPMYAPFFHVSSKHSPRNRHVAAMSALLVHPATTNDVICWDLAHDPSDLIKMSREEIAHALENAWKPDSDGPKLPLVKVSINKSPMVFATLGQAHIAACFDLDLRECHALHAERLAHHRVALTDKLTFAYRALWESMAAKNDDVDASLYAGFVRSRDAENLKLAHALGRKDGMAAFAAFLRRHTFEDDRLNALSVRWRGRHFPETLKPEDFPEWTAHLERARQGYAALQGKRVSAPSSTTG